MLTDVPSRRREVPRLLVPSSPHPVRWSPSAQPRVRSESQERPRVLGQVDELSESTRSSSSSPSWRVPLPSARPSESPKYLIPPALFCLSESSLEFRHFAARGAGRAKPSR